MKHPIQKLLCLLFAVVLMATSLVISPSAALTGNEKNTTIQNHLTAHWDFEGETLEEQLKDKAPKGSFADNLTVKQSAEGAVTVANGVANVQPDTATALWLDMSSGSSDVRMTEKTTIFVKFRFTGTNTGHADIMQLQGLYRIFRHANGDLRITLDNVKNGSSAITLISSDKIQPDQDIYFAFVSNADTTAKTFKGAIYLSTDGVSYTKTDFSYENMTMAFGSGRTDAKTHGLYIGNHRLMKEHGLDYQFDDIRVYNKSFSDHEITQITRLDPDAPVVIGAQETAPVANTQSVRLLSTINSTQYTEAGYTVKVSYNNGTEDVVKTLSRACTAVYQSLTADEGEGNIVEITAESLGGTYLLALTIDKVPCNMGKILFEVTSYAVDENGRHESIPVLFTYENGAFVSAVKK